ncbi:MAG TPA: Spy/CpxP family protein refolding chaperone [Candidatus Competibacteraceae bacterium]|nr:Spy/CpxP family protein refolding chaperone [Candidatus Competibacteraceae bacterium]
MRKKTLAISLASLLGVAGIAYAAGGPGDCGRGFAGWRHAGFHGPMGGPMGLCQAPRGERLESAIGVVQAFVKFTPEQQSAWNELTTALRAANQDLDKLCEERKEAEGDRLARLESWFSGGLDAVRKIRPAYERFQATLSAEQRQALERLWRHGRPS